MSTVPQRVRRRTSYEWSGPSRHRLLDVHARVESHRALDWHDWWLCAWPVVAGLDIALYLTLQTRPGERAIALWVWAPSAIVLATASLLAGALVSALRSGRTWTWSRGVGFAGICALVVSSGVYRIYPSSHDDHPSDVVFQLPLDGPVTVAWGGGTPDVNYHVGAPAERWAYDLFVARDGRTHAGTGAAVTDYWCYGRDVRSPAAGRVITVHDGEPDAVPHRPNRSGRAGNHVVLEVAPDEYLIVAHLQSGSITVAVGQAVQRGDVIGRVGNSGNTSEPHVHLHLQDRAAPDQGEGIPLLFSNYRVEAGGTIVDRGMPRGGQRRGRLLGEVVSSFESPSP
jgi:murein DD-endopeptidase MepM/ murein hydrolase activator NlpD